MTRPSLIERLAAPTITGADIAEMARLARAAQKPTGDGKTETDFAWFLIAIGGTEANISSLPAVAPVVTTRETAAKDAAVREALRRFYPIELHHTKSTKMLEADLESVLRNVAVEPAEKRQLLRQIIAFNDGRTIRHRTIARIWDAQQKTAFMQVASS